MPSFEPRPEDRPFLRRLAWSIAIAALLIVVWRAAQLIILAFGSVLAAVVFRAAARLLRRIGLRWERASLVLGIVLVLAVFGLISWLLTVQFGEQIRRLLSDLPQAVASIEQALAGSPVGEALVAAVGAAAGGATFAELLGTLSLGIGEVALNFIIVVVGGIFLASDPGVYRRGALRLVPPPARPIAARAIGEVSGALRLWLWAQLISMTSMGLLVAAALYIVGLESWGALGLLAGISEFVPYVGPVLAMLPALAIAVQGGGDKILQVVLAFAVVRLIQSNFITPIVARRVVSIPPALTLFVILGTGAVFGFYGLFFSAAMLVVVFVGLRELYLRDTLGEDIEPTPRHRH